MRSFVIHMTGDTGRAENARGLARSLPSAEIMPACIGRDLLAAGHPPPRPGDLYRPHYPFRIGPGELGCFLSHRACWQRIVDDGLDFALIAEDDLSCDQEFWPDALQLATAHAGPDSVIRLPAKRREVPARAVARQGAVSLFLPRRIGLQTVCQVVGRNAAARLLKASEAIDRPVDTFLQMHWITGQPVHTVWPSGVHELTHALGGSTIQTKARRDSKLAREVMRAAYRAQVALRPQRG